MPPGADSEYWNPKNELMPRADLQRLQLVKLRRQVEWAYARSPLYRRMFDGAKFHPDRLKGLADLGRIPFLTREEWMASQEAHPLFGGILAVPADRARRYHYTSSASGRIPLRVLDGIKDWHWGAECWAYGFCCFGVRPADPEQRPHRPGGHGADRDRFGFGLRTGV